MTAPDLPVRRYQDFSAGQTLLERVRGFARNATVMALSAGRSPAKSGGWIRFPFYHHVFDDERRGFARHIYRTKAVLQLETSLPAVPRKTEYVAVYSRDLSKSGVGFLHSEQLYPGEKCLLLLPTHTMPIDVMSCRKLNTQCYLVGACFNIDRENGANLQN
ncbi:MAG: hypothetical protein IIC56_08255 [Proteobacteria bacterium]|nr:hypothetical protein [Pseudomonadota bacterium]